MTKTFCDLCGKVIEGSDYTRFKVKKEWYSWGERGWERLIVHTECWYDLLREIKKRRADNG